MAANGLPVQDQDFPLSGRTQRQPINEDPEAAIHLPSSPLGPVFLYQEELLKLAGRRTR